MHTLKEKGTTCGRAKNNTRYPKSVAVNSNQNRHKAIHLYLSLCMWLESQKESEVSVEEWFSEMTLRLASFALDWKYGGRRIASHSE